jgi:hypothetical protein
MEYTTVSAKIPKETKKKLEEYGLKKKAESVKPIIAKFFTSFPFSICSP